MAAPAQERRSRIDVEQYTIDAEISPSTQSIAVKAVVRFTPLDDNVTSAAFDLNNALNVSRVLDAQDKQIPASRNQQDSTVRLSFEQPLPKGQPVTIAFFYDGRLTGQEDSPVYGIKFAAIHPDFAYLTYPARWFPVSGYTTDRFAADVRVTVPTGYTVLGSGTDSRHAAGDKNVFEFKFEHPSFPGSIAVVKGDPVKVSSEGVTTTLYFRGPEADMAQAYGEQTGRVMSYFTGMFGLPPYANLTVVETEEGAPNGYAAPGLIFLAPRGIGRQRQAHRQPGFTAVVGGAGGTLHAQSSVAHQRAGGLLGTAMDGARQRSRRHGIAGPRRDGGGADRRQCAHHPIGAAGGLFAGVVGADRLERRGRPEHAALPDRRR
jgi:hypothetical protein